MSFDPNHPYMKGSREPSLGPSRILNEESKFIALSREEERASHRSSRQQVGFYNALELNDIDKQLESELYLK